jgi:hypothetical protein
LLFGDLVTLPISVHHSPFPTGFENKINNVSTCHQWCFSKKGSGTQRLAQNSVRERGYYTDPRKRRFQNVIPGCNLLRKNFWNSVSSITCYKHYWTVL